MRRSFGSLLVVSVLVVACGSVDLSQVETCAEMEDIVMDATQNMVNFVDTLTFAQYQDGSSNSDTLPQESQEAWEVLADREADVYERYQELECDYDWAFLEERAGELTFKTRSGEHFIENFQS